MIKDFNSIINHILKHRSVRSFDPNFKIPQEHIDLIIKAGPQASTSCSGQMYSIIDIPREKRNRILSLCGNQEFVLEASYFCIICIDLFRLNRIVELSGGKPQKWPLAGLMIGIFDAGLFSQNMVLAAESLGYDICFCGSCADQPDKMIELLNLPELVMPLTGLAIGKGLEDPPTRPRLSKSFIHNTNAYQEYNNEELYNNIQFISELLNKEQYYMKYSGKKEYSWKEHMKNKFGGKWLNNVENRRKKALEKQKF
ncbi:MAG: nitroreductase family protein [Candidatus Hodarchaeales archaeon]|jgi:nitroreductase